MSTNCLVKKLKSVIDNDSLEIIGHVKLMLTAKTGSPWIKVSCVKNTHVTCSGTLRLDNSSEYTFLANTVVQCTVSGSGYITIEDKYSISVFQSNNVDVTVVLDDLTYTAMIQIGITNTNLVSGNIDVFINKNKQLSDISLLSNRIAGDISKISSAAAITKLKLNSSLIEGTLAALSGSSLTLLSLNNCSKITGNIETLPNKQNITSIEIYNSGVSGSLDAYVSSAIASGKTSATNLPITGALSNLTFNGAKQDTTGISIIAPCFVSWDNIGKISVLTGNYTPANTTHVFCKGYTQEEAETAFQGKTIIRVDA